MELILLRHGQSTTNRLLAEVKDEREVDTGPQDSTLTRLGRRQADLAGKALSCEYIDMILSSPARRALETTQRVKRCIDALPMVDPRVLEFRGVGSAPAASGTELRAMYPGFSFGTEFDNKTAWNLAYLNESKEELYRRAQGLWQDFVVPRASSESGRASRVLVVTHRMFSAYLTGIALGMNLEQIQTGRFQLGNCASTRFEVRSNGVVMVAYANREDYLHGKVSA